MLRSFAARVLAWHYDASPDGAGKRDVRIDLLRGFCVFMMIVDAGDLDPWRKQSIAIHDELTQLGVANSWSPNVGGHELAYWAAHMDEYLRYYARALPERRVVSLASRARL